MLIAARTLRLLAFAVWMGALVFFGAVVAPGAAAIFGTTGKFADFIGRSLFMLHSIGLWCGVAMFLALRLLARRAYKPVMQASLVFAMMLLTFGSNRFILQPMEHDRALAGGNINILLAGSPLREDFDARHRWSTRVEGCVLLCGVALAVLIGMEGASASGALPPRKVFDLSSDD